MNDDSFIRVHICQCLYLNDSLSYILHFRLASGLSRRENLCLRGWLSAIALVEVVQIVRFLFNDSKLDVFFARVGQSRSAKRIVSFLLTLLTLNRIHTARHLHLPGVLTNCAMVHTAEAAFFGFEFYKNYKELKSQSFVMVCCRCCFACAAQHTRLCNLSDRISETLLIQIFYEYIQTLTSIHIH